MDHTERSFVEALCRLRHQRKMLARLVARGRSSPEAESSLRDAEEAVRAFSFPRAILHSPAQR